MSNKKTEKKTEKTAEKTAEKIDVKAAIKAVKTKKTKIDKSKVLNLGQKKVEKTCYETEKISKKSFIGYAKQNEFGVVDAPDDALFRLGPLPFSQCEIDGENDKLSLPMWLVKKFEKQLKEELD